MAQPGCQWLRRGGNICEENTRFSQFSSRALALVQREGEFAAVYEAFLQRGCSPTVVMGGLGAQEGNSKGQENPGWMEERPGSPRPDSLRVMVAEAATFSHVARGRGEPGPPIARRDLPGALTRSSHRGVWAGRDRPAGASPGSGSGPGSGPAALGPAVGLLATRPGFARGVVSVVDA